MGIAGHELRGAKRHLTARSNLGAACVGDAGCEHRDGGTPTRSGRAAAPEWFIEIDDAERLTHRLA